MPAAERHESQSPASRVGTRLLIVGVLLVLAVAGFFGWRYLGTYEDTDDAQVDGHLNALSARVAGYVTEVDVNDNQYVEKGQRLVQIDPRDYQVAVERAKADLADAEAAAQASESQCARRKRERHHAGIGIRSGRRRRAGRDCRRAKASGRGARAIAGRRSE